jgi:hypothetical protein
MVVVNLLKIPSWLNECVAASFFETIDICLSCFFIYAFFILVNRRRSPHDISRQDDLRAVDQEIG